MLRRALEWLAGHTGTDGDADSGDEDTAFVPSPLDRSVRYAHGGSDDGERELAHVRNARRRSTNSGEGSDSGR